MVKYVLILLLICSMSARATTYYVSASGSNSNSGLTTGLPWQTIAKVNATWFAAGDQILFNKGDVFYGMLNLKNNGGTSGVPITYGAYGTGNKPIITGFTTITGWTNEGGGIYSKIITAESQTNMVTINGTQYAMGRYPNTGHLSYESASTNVSITDNQLGTSTIWTGAEAVIQKNGYDIDRCSITNHTGNVLTYTSLGKTSNASAAIGAYFIQNDLRTLDQFGEWYHNNTTGKLSIYFGGSDPTTYTINVATLNNLCFAGSGEDNITIDGIKFEGSIKDALYLSFQQDAIILNNLDVNFAGLDGIHIAGQNDQITNCTLSNINSAGIYANAGALTITSNTITNQGHIEGQGGIGNFYDGAIFLYKDVNNVRLNHIENVGFAGIMLNGTSVNATIKNNYIKTTCKFISDMGAIYLFGARTSILIDGNIIETCGGSGIYLDEYTTNTKIWNNSVFACTYNGIKLHKSHDNSIKNNITYNNGVGLMLENWLNERNLYNDSVVGNSFIAKTSGQYAAYMINWYNDNNIGVLNNNLYARPIDDNLTIGVNNVASGNVLSNKTFAQWQVVTTQDINSKKSPFSISTISDFRFEYNTTGSDVPVVLDQNYREIYTNTDYTTLTIDPYRSILLIKHEPYGTIKKRISVNKKTMVYHGKVLIF